MRRHASALGLAAALAAAAAAPAPALADDVGGGDAYCDYVEGVAAADSAVLMWPELFGSFGYIDQPAVVDLVPESSSNNLRLTAGVNLSLSGVYQGLQTRGRASAECRRHRALDQVEGAMVARALTARVEELEKAMPAADKILAQANADFAARRATAQDVNATRLRVDELRSLLVASRRELRASPEPGAATAGALADLYRADAEVEAHEGKLRRSKAFDVNLRVGYDKFLDNDDEDSPYFAVVQVGFNLGYIFQGGANARAAAARKRMVEERATSTVSDTALESMRQQLAEDRERYEHTGDLIEDLEKQLAALKGIDGDVGRRLRQSIWFDAVKVRAEHAYLGARVDGLSAALGGAGGADE
jgi:hypothetical protein